MIAPVGVLRRYIANPSDPKSLSAQARRRRWQRLRAAFPAIGDMRVIDLGGTPRAWRMGGVVPGELVILNSSAAELAPDPTINARVLQGDACDLPESLEGEQFDLVYSNSVIEHVGGHARRRAFVTSVTALAPRHWVQTPYRYFPIEPHWVFPLMQNLPLAARAWILRHWSMGGRAKSWEDSVRRTMQVEILSRTEMRYYFPDSEIRDERALGLTKSLIAVRGATEAP